LAALGFWAWGSTQVLSADLTGILVAVLQLLSLTLKVLFFCWLFVWVRWTLPRFRYDQLMNLGWKVMLPLALLNLLVTGVIVLAQK
ncbi:MAG TPA: NADH-quinone oxidoreductase subunit H, partial [bacterium]|nr:NADH-quinone oxidoreductase subunit H [bacterium]